MSGGRIRTVKPEWLEDELLAGASDEARVLSIALILMADDHGRGRASIAVIASGAWRYEMERDEGARATETLAKASRALRELVEIGFARLYEVSRQRYYELPNWTRHQRVDKPGQPRVPLPVEAESSTISQSDSDSRDRRETVASDSGESRETLAPDQGSGIRDLGPGGDLTRAPVREARSEPKPRDPMRQSLAQRPTEAPDRVTIQRVEVTFSELRVEAKRGRYSNPAQRDDERLAHLARFANDGGSTLDERMGVLRACILGYLADDSPNVAKARWPLAFLANDPGRYQAAHEEGSPVPSQASDAVSVARAAYGAACERLQRAEGTPDYDDALDAKRAALATLRRAEAE